MKKSEARTTTIWNKYCRAEGVLGYFELKYTGTSKFNLSKFEAHQIDSLIAMQENGLVWKLSDSDMREKPCDVLCTPALTSYVVITYKTVFCMIPVNLISILIDAGAKSIGLEEAKELSEKVVHMK